MIRVSENSDIVGKTVQALRVRERYGVLVAAIWRGGEITHDRPGGLPLHVGDEVLFVGQREQIEQVAASPQTDVIEIGPSAVGRLEGIGFELKINA